MVPCALAALAAISCGGRGPAAPPPASVSAADAETEIARELDDMNEAAAHAEEARYLDHFATGAVFMGTDATERWDVAALRAYAHPKFSQGHGWTLRSVRRAVTVWRTGDVAWFDEDLAGVKLGPVAGQRRDGAGRWPVEGCTVQPIAHDPERALRRSPRAPRRGGRATDDTDTGTAACALTRALVARATLRRASRARRASWGVGSSGGRRPRTPCRRASGRRPS